MPIATKTKTFTIVVDTREQKPFEFKGIVRAEKAPALERIVRGTLPEGDYSIEMPVTARIADRIAIERKSLPDLYQSFTHQRPRFEAEFVRLSAYGYAAVVIEGDLLQIARPNEHLQHHTLTRPKTIVASMLSWSMRYGVHFWPCPCREYAEVLTYRALERWAREHT